MTMFNCSSARRNSYDGRCGKWNLGNGADGIGDTEDKVARVATKESGNEPVSNQTRLCRSRRLLAKVRNGSFYALSGSAAHFDGFQLKKVVRL